ncbi:MAG: RNA degradosome polyphosphate kinase, partial [Pseudomonadales bacterium]|nr:RNA degradosome polyphosphate kinase [Pseudomonadales bacterium]
ALVAAAEAGKSVLAVIELEARDNEESNVQLAKRLEAAGVQIVYGIVGLKIHCKVAVIVRREGDESVTYTHFGTGNYHPQNARTYTDLSLFTKDPQLGDDAHRVLSYLTSGHLTAVEKLVVAPFHLRRTLYELIEREIEHARAGRRAHICIKVNSLTDIAMIDHLYAASEAGVEIDLIIRRQCCLRPAMEGLSSRIRVRSIIGRFLEHSRIFLFANGEGFASEQADVFIGSADLMERNLDDRVELLVPIQDPTARRQVVDGIMHANLKDTRQTWLLDSDGHYVRHAERDGFCAQSFFMSTPDPTELGRLDDLLAERID